MVGSNDKHGNDDDYYDDDCNEGCFGGGCTDNEGNIRQLLWYFKQIIPYVFTFTIDFEQNLMLDDVLWLLVENVFVFHPETSVVGVTNNLFR